MSDNEAKDQPANISDLQENFSKQQKKISALKELVRKSGTAHGKSTSFAQEKVKNIAQQLKNLKSKARSRQKLDHDTSTNPIATDVQNALSLSQTQLSIPSPSCSNSSTPNPTPLQVQDRSDSITTLSSPSSSSHAPTSGSEKIILLRQQMEHNKLRMAQRASSKLHLEQLVSELKEKFDSTQQSLTDTTELGKSMSDLSALLYTPTTRERHKSATDLSTQPFSLEKERMKFLENRCRLLEKQLEKERQSHSGPTDAAADKSSSKVIKELENNILELEKTSKELKLDINSLTAENERLRSNSKLQTDNFETDLENENERLRNELDEKLKRISELEQANNELDSMHGDLKIKYTEMEDLVEQLQSDLSKNNEKLVAAQDKCQKLEDELVKLQQIPTPLSLADDTETQVNVEMVKQIQELQSEIQSIQMENAQLKMTKESNEKLEISDASVAEKIASLEATIESQRADLRSRQEALKTYEEEVMEKTIELNVLSANFKVLEAKLQASSKNKPLFSTSGSSEEDKPELLAEISQLKQKLDESNKAMIKMKLKCKQTEKQVDKLKKSSNLHEELVKLAIANEELQQKIVELEDEKGQWQLSQVDDAKTTSGESLNEDNQQNERIKQLEQEKSEQEKKLDAMQLELEIFQHQLCLQKSEEDARVKSEMGEIQLEEKLEEQTQQLKQIQEELTLKETEAMECKQHLEEMKEQKHELEKKLEHYIAENMELLDKAGKQSKKSSSSAESIEIVERLTLQERAEIEEFNKRLEQASGTKSEPAPLHTDMEPELSESLIKLREESSELMKKIELFTAERREVLEKMETLTTENHGLIEKIEQLTKQVETMESNAAIAENTKSKLEIKLQDVSKEKDRLALQIADTNAQKSQLSQELSSLQKSSEIVAAIDSSEGATLFDKCEKSLSKLNSELETYRRANDRNAKFNASKKLAKEAKNAYTQLSELLQKVKEASTAVETVTVVETVVAVTAANGKALAEYEQLTTQNRQLKATIEELRQELQETSTRDDDLESMKITEIPAATAEQLEKLQKYEEDCINLQSVVEDLRMQLVEARTAGEEKSDEIARLKETVASLEKMSTDLDVLLKDKESSYETQIHRLTNIRNELEGKCETYEAEMEILQTLVTEQKQQLIEAYKESEHEINMKLLDLQQRDELIAKLRAEMSDLKETSKHVGAKVSEDVERECEKLREALKINKSLITEQINEIANKQETIDTLNEQITDLYKTMDDNTNKVIEKEDELAYMQELIDANSKEMDRLRKDNDEQKSMVDKLLNELQSHKATVQQLPHLESELHRLESANKQLEATNKQLDQRNKDQLEKLKKYAANLKKRVAHCHELEEKIKQFEQHSVEPKNDTPDHSELQQMTTLNLELKQRMDDMAKKVQDMEKALQIKTSELEEKQKAQQSTSDWGDFNFGTDTENNDELAQKNTEIAKLKMDLKEAQETMRLQELSITELSEELSHPNQAPPVEGNTNNEYLQSQLAAAESSLMDVQSELLELRENSQLQMQAQRELQEALEQKQNLISSLQSQIAQLSANEQTHLLLQQKVQEQEVRLSELGEELKAKALKFEKSKAVIKERNNQIHRLQGQIKDLQDKLSVQPEEEPLALSLKQSQLDAAPALQITKDEYETLQQAYDKLNEKYTVEKSNFQETISRLETLHDGIQAKLQQDKSHIEVLEQENSKFKETICRLEECVATFEEKRATMERLATLLDAQMQSRADAYEKTEDELIYRLNRLFEHDEVIGQRLLDSQGEKEELQERIERLQAKLNEASSEYTTLEKEFSNHREQVTDVLETDISTLREQLAANDKELKHLHSVYDAKLAAKNTEIDELECELNDQLEKINSEKRSVTIDLEKVRDECNEHKDEIVRLNESLNALEQSKQELERETTWLRMQNESSQQDQFELQELRMQAVQDKTEIDNLRHQIESLAANHEVELQALRTQISELDTVRMQVGQNQTDDQVFIETENKRLTDLIAEKEALIENYQRQNLQLQMAAAAAAAAVPATSTMDPFALTYGVGSAQNLPATSTIVNEDHRLRLERDLSDKTELATRLQRDLNALQTEFHTVLEGNNDMQRQLMEKNRELDRLRTTQSSNDVIPAPPMFFASEQAMPSPFDDIIQARSIDTHLESSNNNNSNIGNNSATLMEEQPTIEDLQRNVSDLEKHAQDLENKLTMRNQREGDYEERMRDMQSRLKEAERRTFELEQQVNITNLELERVQQQNIILSNQLVEAQHEFEENSMKLQNENENLKAISKEQEQLHLSELQEKVNNLQKLLEERDNELKTLRSSIDEDKQSKEIVKNLESLIIPDAIAQATVGSGDRRDGARPTLDMFFGGSTAPEFENLVIPQISEQPVVEEPIVPEKAYVCHPDEPAHPSRPTVPALDLNYDWGDSWGGGGVESEIETIHSATETAASTGRTSLISREQQLEIKLQDESERVQELQMLLERCEQQKQELQVKSGKLMKKLKEYKVKIDELQDAKNATTFRKSTSVESNSNFNDLDAAIQEELKSQIKILEEKLQEQLKVQESYAMEKEKLLKRIDTLTAGNDRMSEMKDRQDMDVQMYQSRIRQLQEQLQSLQDWGTESNATPSSISPITQKPISETNQPSAPSSANMAEESTLENRIIELTAEIQELNNDRQELQALLDDEKANVTRAELTIKELQLQIANSNDKDSSETSKYNDLKIEYQNLQQTYNNIYDSNKKLTEEISGLKTEYDHKLQLSQTKVEQLQTDLEAAKLSANELQNEIHKLQSELIELKMAKNNENDDSNERSKLEDLLNENQLLQTQISELQSALSSRQSLTQSSPSASDELLAQLQEKDVEILHLRKRIEDLMREDQTEKLVLEILTKNQEIHMLKIKVKDLEDEKVELEQSISKQITSETQAESNVEFVLRDEINQLKQRVQDLEQEKQNMEEELRVLNDHVMSSLQMDETLKATVLELDMKNIEITELRKTLEVIKAQQQLNAGESSTSDTNSTAQTDVAALNAQWETIVEQKCTEIAQMWREHLDQREQEFKVVESRLLADIAACRSSNIISPAQQQGISAETTATSTPVSASTSASGTSSAAPSKEGTPLRSRLIEDPNSTDDAILEKMQAALESQEMEIVTLKEQLAIRSAEYARLAAQYDPFKLQTTLSHSGMNTVGPSSLESAAQIKRHAPSTPDNSLVPKSELDLALYMLHQRDMRCEEMTVELVSLLEERDTLQLKLSNTLRQVEAIKAQTNYVEPPAASRTDTALTTPSSDVLNKSFTALQSSSDSDNELNQKLFQLQSVNHSKDKVIKEEREQRIRQMEKIQQDVAKMPPAAMSELVGADLSQSSQSPSSVLLNWLWGNKPDASDGTMPN